MTWLRFEVSREDGGPSIDELARRWQRRFIPAAAKRVGSFLRGNNSRIRKRTGRLRRGVVTDRPHVNRGWRGARGVGSPVIGTFRIVSGGPHAGPGTVAFVETGVHRARRSRKLRRALMSVARATFRKTIAESGRGDLYVSGRGGGTTIRQRRRRR